VAALVNRQTSIDWRCVRKNTDEAGAVRMLNTGLQLASDMLHLQLSDGVRAAVGEDTGAAKLAASVQSWLSSGTNVTLFERATFRLRMRGSMLAAPAYLLRLALSPTEEDWEQGNPQEEHKVRSILRRPFRLARKYSRSRQS